MTKYEWVVKELEKLLSGMGGRMSGHCCSNVTFNQGQVSATIEFDIPNEEYPDPYGAKTSIPSYGGYHDSDWGIYETPTPEKPIECGCGAKAVGIKDYHPGHATYCPVKEVK